MGIYLSFFGGLFIAKTIWLIYYAINHPEQTDTDDNIDAGGWA